MKTQHILELYDFEYRLLILSLNRLRNRVIADGITTTQKSQTVGLYIDVTYDADGYIDDWTKIVDEDTDADVYYGTFTGATVTYDSDVLTIDSTDLALDDCTIYTFKNDTDIGVAP